MPPTRVIVTFAAAVLTSIGSIVDQIWPYMPRDFPALLLGAAVVLWLTFMQTTNRYFMVRQIQENQAEHSDRIVDEIVFRFRQIDLVGRIVRELEDQQRQRGILPDEHTSLQGRDTDENNRDGDA